MVNGQLSELKKRALLAKQRMRMGYWQAMNEEKMKKLEELGSGYQSVQLVKDMQLAKFERDDRAALGFGQVLREEALYEQVCQMLNENELISNPIGKLIDREVYEGLDEGNRQKYILDLSRKFCEMKERYYKERRLRTTRA